MVVQDPRMESFEAKVQFYLNLGWLPQGGVAIISTDTNNSLLYAQALIKESL